MKHSWLLALSCAVSAAHTLFPLTAAAADEQPEEVVVTSSRISTPLRHIGTSVSVVDAERIREIGAMSLIDAIRTLPSVTVSNTGGNGQVSTLRIRGEEGFRTLVLIDGMEVSDPSVTQVQPQLEHVLSSGIERVEVLRGPQGLNYGADAGGVINISTRQQVDDELQGNVDAMGGRYGTRQLSGNIGAGNEQADFYLSGSKLQTDGFNARVADAIKPDDDGYENRTLHARVGVNLSERLRVDAVHRDVEGDTRYDGCFDPVTFANVHGCDANFQQQASRLAATYSADHGSHSLAWSSTTTDRNYFVDNLSDYYSNGERQRWEYLGTLTALSGARFVYGVDHKEEENNGDSRDQTGYYLEYLSEFSDTLFLTAGVRHDDNEDFGNHNSYRVSGAWLIPAGDDATIKLRGSYGTGFRAPSPYEAAYNRGPFAYPPASLISLVEETSKGHELAVEYIHTSGLRLEAVYFDQTVEDAITFDSAGFSGYLQDSGDSTSEGVELSAQLPLAAQLFLDANYTYNDAERPDGTQRQLRPQHLANLGVSWHSRDGSKRISTFYRAVRDNADVVNGATVALDDYAVIDVTASYDLSPALQVYGRLENLGDEDYQEVFGYNTSGRAGYLGVRFNF